MTVPEEVLVEVRVPVLLSISSVAAILGRSAKTVRRRIDDGSLPAVIEHGRVMVRGDELRAYIEALDRPGAPVRRRRPGGDAFARLA